MHDSKMKKLSMAALSLLFFTACNLSAPVVAPTQSIPASKTGPAESCMTSVEYNAHVAQYMQMLSTSLNDYDVQYKISQQNPSMQTNADWIKKMDTALALIKQAALNIQSLRPPTGWVKYNNDLQAVAADSIAFSDADTNAWQPNGPDLTSLSTAFGHLINLNNELDTLATLRAQATNEDTCP